MAASPPVPLLSQALPMRVVASYLDTPSIVALGATCRYAAERCGGAGHGWLDCIDVPVPVALAFSVADGAALCTVPAPAATPSLMQRLRERMVGPAAPTPDVMHPPLEEQTLDMVHLSASPAADGALMPRGVSHAILRQRDVAAFVAASLRPPFAVSGPVPAVCFSPSASPADVVAMAVPGTTLDVLDHVRKWYHATVLDAREAEDGSKAEVYITYHGWGSRWNEWVELPGDRCQPYGTTEHAHPEEMAVDPFWFRLAPDLVPAAAALTPGFFNGVTTPSGLAFATAVRAALRTAMPEQLPVEEAERLRFSLGSSLGNICSLHLRAASEGGVSDEEWVGIQSSNVVVGGWACHFRLAFHRSKGLLFAQRYVAKGDKPCCSSLGQHL